MSKGIHKKLESARTLAAASGILLAKLEARFGDQFSVGLGMMVKQAIHECRQKEVALALAAKRKEMKAERNSAIQDPSQSIPGMPIPDLQFLSINHDSSR